jgi:flagellar motor switch protein FliN/FliY
MNVKAAQVIADGMLKGAFDVFDAMLSLSCKFDPEPAEAADETRLAEALIQCPVVLQGRIQNNLGAVALLFSTRAALQLAALVQESDAGGQDHLSPQDKAVLRDVAEPALGGGVTNLMERFGRNVEQLEGVEVLGADASNAAELFGLFDGAAVLVPFSFNGGEGWRGEAFAVYSEAMEKLVPSALLKSSGSPGDLSREAALTPAEIGDILSGFDPDAVEEAPAGRPSAAPRPAPGNLDMVLDIRLVATARLGRVEMPLGDILALGPGSIIEVGQMVDEPVELLINEKLVARGDVVVVDEKFGLRITEIISARERIETLR